MDKLLPAGSHIAHLSQAWADLLDNTTQAVHIQSAPSSTDHSHQVLPAGPSARPGNWTGETGTQAGIHGWEYRVARWGTRVGHRRPLDRDVV